MCYRFASLHCNVNFQEEKEKISWIIHRLCVSRSLYLLIVFRTPCKLLLGKWNSFCNTRHCSSVTAMAVRSLALLQDVNRMPYSPRQMSAAKCNIFIFFEAFFRNDSSMELSSSVTLYRSAVGSALVGVAAAVVFGPKADDDDVDAIIIFLYRMWYCLMRSKLSQLDRCCSRV